MKVDVILINPPYLYLTKSPIRTGLGASLDMPPLGLYYIATVLEENNYTVRIFDFNIIQDSDIELIISEIVSLSPKIIGFSVSTPCYNVSVQLAKRIKEDMKENVTVVYGGYHVSFLPNDPLKERVCNYVIRGEGEYTLIDLCNYIMNKGKKNIESIKGLSYINDDGSIVHNVPNIVRIKNLDSLPYPKRYYINPNKYNVPGTIMASRGCVARCQFCAAGAWGGIMLRSIENIVGEIKELVSLYGFEHICFIDNTFILSKERVHGLAKRISNLNMDVSFSLETRAGLLNEELILDLKRMNTISIQFGVETGNDYIMKSINKEITIKSVFESVGLCLKNNINVMCSFIIGHPEDTVETVNDTITVAKQLKRLGAQVKFEILTPYPGTEVYMRMNDLGIELITSNFDEWNGVKAVFNNKYITHKDIDRLLMKAITEVNVI